MPLLSQSARVVERKARRPSENQPGLPFETAAMPPGAILQPLDHILVEITNQYPSHKTFSIKCYQNDSVPPFCCQQEDATAGIARA